MKINSAFDRLHELVGRTVFVASDYDFTLREVAPTPQEATLTPERREVIRALQGAGHKFAIITGRGLESVLAASGLELPACAYGYGLEVRHYGNVWLHPDHNRARVDALAAVLERAVQRFPGAWVENGGMALAVHWRQTPVHYHNAVAEEITVVMEATEEAEGFKLVVDAERFGALIEQTIDWNKGSALGKLLELAGWTRESGPVIALGDTEADDPMFKVAEVFGGFGIRVGDRVSATAHAHLQNPEEVFKFFAALARHTRGATQEHVE